MKKIFSPWMFAALVFALGAGCAGLNYDATAVSASDERVLTGTVICPSLLALPDHASVLVRVLGTPNAGGPPNVLGEQTITEPTGWPVKFRIEYRAEDAVLRRGVNVEARVSAGGKLRFQTVNGHVVTLGNASTSHEVAVEALLR